MHKKKHAEDKISRILNDSQMVMHALQQGINAALLRHKQLGYPVCTWRNGKVVWIAPEDIKIDPKQ